MWFSLSQLHVFFKAFTALTISSVIFFCFSYHQRSELFYSETFSSLSVLDSFKLSFYCTSMINKCSSYFCQEF